MTTPPSRPLPAPRAPPAAAPGGGQATLAALAMRQDWPAAFARLRARPPARFPFPLPLAALMGAAIDAGAEDVRDWAAANLVGLPMPPAQRAAAALRLARAGRGMAAWRMLLADPALCAEDGPAPLMAVLLATLARDPALEPPWREAAQRLRAFRQGQAAEAVLPPALPDPGPPAPPRFPLDLRFAPGLPPEAEGMIAEALKLAETIGQARRPAGLHLLRDAVVTPPGRVWDLAGGLKLNTGPHQDPPGAAAMAAARPLASAVLASGATNNFYHWMAAWLPALGLHLASPAIGRLPVLLRENPARFQAQSLDLLGRGAEERLPLAATLRVRTLYMPAHYQVRLDPAGGIEPLLARLVAAAAAACPEPPVRAAALYISRRDSVQRPMANERELEAALIRRGYAVVAMSEWNLAQQIAIVRAARRIVAPHGAGLSLLLAARPGMRVFELLPYDEAALQVRLCMARLSRFRGHRHMLWVEPARGPELAWQAQLALALPALDAFMRG